MIVVAHAFQIHKQRRMALQTQCGRGQQRSLQAMPFALPQRSLRRARRVGVVVRQRIEKLLYARRRLQRAQRAQVRRREAEALAGAPSPQSRTVRGQCNSHGSCGDYNEAN
jgi:hypothetical protein